MFATEDVLAVLAM